MATRNDKYDDTTITTITITMMMFMMIGLAMLLGYLLGSIPFGFLAGKCRGIDLRKEGSGNIGATNALRTLGKLTGIFVFFLDALKGAVASWIGLNWIGKTSFATSFSTSIETNFDPSIIAITAGFSAILGHNYPCWLKFKGGKGIATSAGVLLILIPKGLMISSAVFFLMLMITRLVSLSSMFAAISLPIGTWITGERGWLFSVSILMGLLAIYQHRSNIYRLWKGTEPPLFKKRQ